MPDPFAVGILAAMIFGLLAATFTTAGDDAKNVKHERRHFNDWRGIDDEPPGFHWPDWRDR